MDEQTKYKNEIADIIQGRTHYGLVSIEKKVVSKNVTWIGTNGYTASVGQWIRHISTLIDNGVIPKQGYRWYTIVTVPVSPQVSKSQCMWYYGVELDNMIFVCGGCTDFSGEGGHGRMLAEYFLKGLFSEQVIIERNADYLISLLTE